MRELQFGPLLVPIDHEVFPVSTIAARWRDARSWMAREGLSCQTFRK